MRYIPPCGIMGIMPLDTTVSVILPAHNEAPNVKAVIEGCIDACRERFSDFEVVVVDDGSSDSTGDVVNEIARSNPGIKLVSHASNRGYGAALRSGFEAARNEWIFFTDSDGQFDPAEMADFMPLLDTADIVAGYRLVRRDNFYRRFMGWLYTRLIDLFFGTNVRDVNCAFKFVRAEFLRGLKLESEGALINAEILAIARKQNLKVVEKGVHHYPRRAGEQSGGSGRVIWKALREYLSLYRRLKKG